MQLNTEWATAKDALAFRLSRTELCHAVGPVLSASYQPPIFKSADTLQETLLCL